MKFTPDQFKWNICAILWESTDWNNSRT